MQRKPTVSLDATPPLDRELLLRSDDDQLTAFDRWNADNGAPSPEDAIIMMIDYKTRAARRR